MLSRRDFCIVSGALAGATLVPSRMIRAHLAPSTLAARPLGKDVWLVTEGGGNVLVVRTTEGPVVIDAKVGAVAWELDEQVRTHGGKPARMLINTHHHGDHIGGNFMFSDHAEIVAHRALRPRLEATIEQRIVPAMRAQVQKLRLGDEPGEADRIDERIATLDVTKFVADTEFDDTLELTVGATVIQLHHFGAGHTDNDVVVYLPQADVLHTGDLVFNRLHPFIDRPAKADTTRWEHSLRAARALGKRTTKVVPGHGEVGTVAILAEQEKYFTKMRDIVTHSLDGGKSRDEIIKIAPEEFASYGFEGLRGRALGAIHDELVAARGGVTG